jgi:hypothetical protein
MRKTAAAIFAVVVTGVALVAVSIASGSPSATKYTAKLTAGQEVPKPTRVPAGATGAFTATLTGKKLAWTLTFSHLSGAALAAHIHLGKKGVAGNVLVPLCPTATSSSCKSPLKGSATLTAGQIKTLNAGGLYVNVHTKKNANGEIRGQIGM